MSQSGQEQLTLVCACFETGVEPVEDFFKDVGRNVVAAVVDQEDLDVPFSQRETFNTGGLVSARSGESVYVSRIVVQSSKRDKDSEWVRTSCSAQ